MVQLYYTLVTTNGPDGKPLRTIDQVPERYRAEVQAMLEPLE